MLFPLGLVTSHITCLDTYTTDSDRQACTLCVTSLHIMSTDPTQYSTTIGGGIETVARIKILEFLSVVILTNSQSCFVLTETCC